MIHRSKHTGYDTGNDTFNAANPRVSRHLDETSKPRSGDKRRFSRRRLRRFRELGWKLGRRRARLAAIILFRLCTPTRFGRAGKAVR
jgi:hypothetical protein